MTRRPPLRVTCGLATTKRSFSPGMYVCAADFMWVRVSGYCSRDLYVGHGGLEICGFWHMVFYLFILISSVWVIVD